VLAALDRMRPGIGERMGQLLGPPLPPSFEPLVTALINEVTGQPDSDEVLLVLDDYQVISSRLVHESFGFLLEHRPLGLHLASASRSDPPLALVPLRGCGQLTELRAADLRFTPEEAATGRSNQAIPGQLVVTLDTVKKHVSHVLGKLGAARPHRGRHPRTRAQPGSLTRSDAAWRSRLDRLAHQRRSGRSLIPNGPWCCGPGPRAPRERLAHVSTLVPPPPREIPPGMSTFG
jgi:hypothetical protein